MPFLAILMQNPERFDTFRKGINTDHTGTAQYKPMPVISNHSYFP